MMLRILCAVCFLFVLYGSSNTVAGAKSLETCPGSEKCRYRFRAINRCTTSSDCSYGRVCCKSCYGNRCVKKPESAVKQCYTDSSGSIHRPCTTRTDRCASDEDCKRGYHCCRDNCGLKICKWHSSRMGNGDLTDRLTKCPYSSKSRCPPFGCSALPWDKRKITCYTDSDCAPDSTCCAQCCNTECTKKPTEPQCPNGEQIFNCFANPCEVTKCVAYPHLGFKDCKSDYCGGCNARFFENGQEVDCSVPEPTPKLPKCPNFIRCRTVRCMQLPPQCLSNADCTLGQYCCQDCCSKKCMPRY